MDKREIMERLRDPQYVKDWFDQIGHEVQTQIVDRMWQPIETAPKSVNSWGATQRVLVTGKYGPSTAHFSPDDERWHMHSWLNQNEQPTHWMPLPPEPSASDDEWRQFRAIAGRE